MPATRTRGRRHPGADNSHSLSLVSSSPRNKSIPGNNQGGITIAVWNMKPRRKVITRSPHRSVGAVHEPWRQSEPIQHESHLEKQCIEVLLLMPCVVQIESQPFSVEFTVEGRQRTYTPDLRVTLADGSQALVEPKGQPFVGAFRDLLAAGLRDAIRSLSLPLYLVPSELIDKARANRASEIRSMARRTPPTGAMDALLSWMENQRRPTVGDAEQGGHPFGHIGYAVGRRLLSVGPSFDLSPQQPLYLASTHEHIHIDDWLGYPGRAENVAA